MASLLLRASGRAARQAPGLLRGAGALSGSGDAAARWPQREQECCSTSYAAAAHSEQADDGTARKARVSRLLYRSKQRGFLEMDLLVGMWAQEHLPRAGESMLAAFEEVLEQENPDLFKWLTGQLPAPQELAQNEAFQALHRSVGAQLRETVQSAARTKPGAEWVRGWDDWKQQPQPQPQQQPQPGGDENSAAKPA